MAAQVEREHGQAEKSVIVKFAKKVINKGRSAMTDVSVFCLSLVHLHSNRTRF